MITASNRGAFAFGHASGDGIITAGDPSIHADTRFPNENQSADLEYGGVAPTLWANYPDDEEGVFGPLRGIPPAPQPERAPEPEPEVKTPMATKAEHPRPRLREKPQKAAIRER